MTWLGKNRRLIRGLNYVKEVLGRNTIDKPINKETTRGKEKAIIIAHYRRKSLCTQQNYVWASFYRYKGYVAHHSAYVASSIFFFLPFGERGI